MKLCAYLQHGKAGGPYRTEAVEVKEAPMAHHKAGLSWTATGYGARIPTVYQVKWLGQWRRVYCRIYSNSGTLYIMSKFAEKDGRIIVSIDQE